MRELFTEFRRVSATVLLGSVVTAAAQATAAYAGYLLCLLGEREGLDPLARYWRQHTDRRHDMWRKLVYRAIARLTLQAAEALEYV